MTTKTTCLFFDTQDIKDMRQGCCGICNNYDYTKEKCNVENEVVEWSESIKQN